MKVLRLLWRDEGQDLTEYALLLVLIALVLVSAVGNLSTAITKIFSSMTSALAAPPTQ